MYWKIDNFFIFILFAVTFLGILQLKNKKGAIIFNEQNVTTDNSHLRPTTRRSLDEASSETVFMEHIDIFRDTVIKLEKSGKLFVIHDRNKYPADEQLLSKLGFETDNYITVADVQVDGIIPDGVFFPEYEEMSKRPGKQQSYYKWVDPFERNIAKLKGTTGTMIPKLFKDKLLSYSSINESSENQMAATEAVEKLEKIIGWNTVTSDFIDPTPLEDLKKIGLNSIRAQSHHHLHNHKSNFVNTSTRQTATDELLDLNGRPLWDLVDIVVPSIRDLDFLEEWKPFIKEFHIIVIQDGDPKKRLKIPSWANFQLYNRLDIDKALGEDAWIISTRDASIRNFGFLVSDKDIIYTLDDDCLPATFNGELVDSITEHVRNLLTPSTPYFFNTIYDPYRPGSDFVRGYPYSLRSGVPTAISHGLWMNAYDYDAPTQLLKVSERNTRYHDMTLTVPKGSLYPMCSMNVAFNKKLIGPAFMQGLMGDNQPWARYDDMFAGWASKVVCDHLGIGVKSGAPYIKHNKASNPFTNLKKEYKGLFWQEELIAFFERVKLSPKSSTAVLSYLELADIVSKELSHLNPYFKRLARAMKKWVEVWERRFGRTKGFFDCNNPSQVLWNKAGVTECVPTLIPVASRSSLGPGRGDGGVKDSTCAIFTIANNEKVFLPMWIRHYSKYVPMQDLWILDHNTIDGSTDPSILPPGINVRRVYGEIAWMPHHFINRQVEMHIQRLLMYGYPCVLFAEIDEFVVADVDAYPGGLSEYLDKFLHLDDVKVVAVAGHHLAHVSIGDSHIEPAINLSAPMLLPQRSYWYKDVFYNKPLLTKIPMTFGPGHHVATFADGSSLGGSIFTTQLGNVDENLFMVHLHYFDMDICLTREKHKHESAKNSGKAQESELGMNMYASKSFEKIKVLKYVCGISLASIQPNGEAKLPDGTLITEIPQRLKLLL